MKLSFSILWAFTFFCVVFLSGCQTLDYSLVKQSSIDKQIAAARAETETRLKALSVEEVGLLKQVIKEYQNRDQLAADSLFKGLVVGGYPKAPTRYEIIMGHSLELTALQLPPATPAAQARAFKELKTELDEAKISLEVLRNQYDRELVEAKIKVDAKEKDIQALNDRLGKIDKDRADILTKANAQERDLQDKKDVIQNQELVKKTKEAEEASSVQAIRVKLSAIVGGLALICLAGAVFSPVFKAKFGAACALLALISVGIWWVQPWHVALALGLGILSLVLWATYNHYMESKAATSTYLAIQSIKDKAKDEYDRVVKPALQEWQTKYLKDGTVVPDASIETLIDKRLMQTNSK